MLWAEVDWSLCHACKACKARLACKTRAVVKMDYDELAFVDLTRCLGCGKCIKECAFKAIRLKNSTRVEERRPHSP